MLSCFEGGGVYTHLRSKWPPWRSLSVLQFTLIKYMCLINVPAEKGKEMMDTYMYVLVPFNIIQRQIYMHVTYMYVNFSLCEIWKYQISLNHSWLDITQMNKYIQLAWLGQVRGTSISFILIQVCLHGSHSLWEM